jgi:hypothetical protein
MSLVVALPGPHGTSASAPLLGAKRTSRIYEHTLEPRSFFLRHGIVYLTLRILSKCGEADSAE